MGADVLTPSKRGLCGLFWGLFGSFCRSFCDLDVSLTERQTPQLATFHSFSKKAEKDDKGGPIFSHFSSIAVLCPRPMTTVDPVLLSPLAKGLHSRGERHDPWIVRNRWVKSKIKFAESKMESF